MKRDRKVVARAAEEFFMLDGQRHETYDAVDYLVSQGFSDADARAYLRTLPRCGS